MEFAAKDNRIILTRNIKHFIALQGEYYKHGFLHKGIVVTDYLPLKELIRRVAGFLNKKKVSEMRNCIDWLQNYK